MSNIKRHPAEGTQAYDLEGAKEPETLRNPRHWDMMTRVHETDASVTALEVLIHEIISGPRDSAGIDPQCDPSETSLSEFLINEPDRLGVINERLDHLTRLLRETVL